MVRLKISNTLGGVVPRFSKHFKLELSQHQLDFVDVNNEHDTPVYVDPYAIEVRDDEWAAKASESIRIFFKEVLDAVREGDWARAENLMSHLSEPQETFLGVSRDIPQGKGVGRKQSQQLIRAIRGSKAFKTGLLSDLSEMALYVDGIDRDKISDLTTNIIRNHLVDYTQQQCDLYEIETEGYNGPALWDNRRKNWIARSVQLPFIKSQPILLVPKYIVRRKLSLDSQEFYNKQITDYLVAENLRANSSLVQVLKTTGEKVVRKGDVREKNPKSKTLIANTVAAHPELLDLYKKIAKQHGPMVTFDDEEDTPTLTAVCSRLADRFQEIQPGPKNADKYHTLVMGSLTALFYPDLILPRKEWDIHDGRKRVDLVFTNAADTGFFSQRRDDKNVGANTVIVECKNYTSDIANPEIDQLLGRFDKNRGYFGIITCRSIDNARGLQKRLVDAASRQQGYIIALTDDDIVTMLRAKANLEDERIQARLHSKFRDLLT